jgi:hypothetical protein
MTESSASTLQRVAHVLGVGQKLEPPNPFQTILRMQHFQLWGFIFLILAIALIIWLIQKKLENIDKQYKEQFVILHRLFKSHQELQVKVHQNGFPNNKVPAQIPPAPPASPEPLPEPEPQPVVEDEVVSIESGSETTLEQRVYPIAEEKILDDVEELPDFLNE